MVFALNLASNVDRAPCDGIGAAKLFQSSDTKQILRSVLAANPVPDYVVIRGGLRSQCQLGISQ